MVSRRIEVSGARALTALLVTALASWGARADAQAPPTDRSAVSARSISVPQGEGKLEGLGESFSAQMSTGNVGEQVPLNLPRARGDAQPALHLAYSSSAGAGLAGIGWDVSYPAITRQTDRGIPAYADPAIGGDWQPNQDRFLFGSDELVPLCRVDSARQCGRALGGEAMPAWSPGWTYFRKRIESGFERFFWSPNHATWVVEEKSGVTFELGTPLDGSASREALEASPVDPTKVFRWNVAREYDAVLDPTAAPGTVRPRNGIVYRFTTTDGLAYLTDIFDTPPRGAPANADTISYAHHTALVYETRPDVVTSYRRGWPTRNTLRLKGVDVTSKTFLGAGRAREMVRRYHLLYDAATHASLLSSVVAEGRCGGAPAPAGIAEDGTQRLPATTGCPALPPVSFEYTRVAGFAADGSPVAADVPGFEPFDDRVHPFAGSPLVSIDGTHADLFDVNSDGLPDVLATTPGQFGTSHGVFFQGALGAADTFSASTIAVHGVNGDSYANVTYQNPNVTLQDIDGDGVVDLVHMPQAQTYAVYTPTQSGGAWAFEGRSVPTASHQNVHIDFTHNAADIRTMDVNADGLLDVVFTAGTSVQTFFSLARFPGGADQYGQSSWSSAQSASLVNDAVSFCVPYASASVRFSDVDVRVADMNGDGLEDIVRVRPADVRYWPGRGNGLWGTGSLANCPGGTFGPGRSVSMAGSPYFTQDPSAIRFDDVNADGLEDMLQVRQDAVDIWLNVDGAGFTPQRHILKTTYGIPTGARVRVADINGSGTRDILWGDARSYRYVDLAGAAQPHLLSRVENGLGKTTEIQYASSVSLMLTAARAGKPWQTATPMPIQVVTRVVESNNLAVDGIAASQVTEYAYSDPVYDGRQREFRGFRRARMTKRGDASNPTSSLETTYLLGECEEEPESPSACTRDGRWRDNPREALKGLPLATDTFGESGEYLSTTHRTYRLRRLYVGLDGREVRHAFVSSEEAYVYDNGPFVAAPVTLATTDVELEPTLNQVQVSRSGSLTLRATAGTVHTRTTTVIDPFGNKTDSIAAGCVDGCASPDEVITTHETPGRRGDDPSGWMWRTVESYVIGSAGVDRAALRAGVPSSAARRKRTLTDYDLAGHATTVRAELTGTLPLDRFHEDPSRTVAPPPGGASQDGFLTVSTAAYDEIGNVVREAGAHGRCRSVAYDDAFAQLPTLETVYVGAAADANGCGTLALVAAGIYDRGLATPTLVQDIHGEVTTLSYDSFGRPLEVHKPDPVVLGVASTPASMRYEFILPSDARVTPYSLIYTQTQSGPDTEASVYTESWQYVDGMGRALVTLEQADPGAGDGAPFIARGQTARDAKGAVHRTFEPYFYAGAARSFPLGVSPGAPFAEQDHDSFGRVTRTAGLDGATTLKSVFHALEVERWDAADLEPGGPHQGTFVTERRDGHGRMAVEIERVASGGRVEAHETRMGYLPTGETANVIRVNGGSAPVVHWARYDSLGRMVLNVDANASKGFSANSGTDANALKAWRYAYDDDGDLLGVSDARGCGANYAYDSAGRLVAEDYSPCRLSQEPYSPPDPVTGAGVEVWSVYDAPDGDARAIAGFPIDPKLCAGRLVSVYDRASETVARPDGRGRATGFARRASIPGREGAPWIQRYAAHWFVQSTTYDAGDRQLAQTTGADVAELLGPDGASAVAIGYTARGAVRSIGGSYGPLVTAIRHDADGLPTQIAFGDLAGTATSYAYDVRRRLKSVQTTRTAPAAWGTSPPVVTPPASAEAGTRALVLQSTTLSYDAVDNPVALVDGRSPSEWPPGAQPATRTMQYDDLYRLTHVTEDYPGGDDAWTSPSEAEDRGGFAQHQPAPHVAFDNRVRSESYAYDWLGNTIATGDDAEGFYDRSLGTIRNGDPATGPYRLIGATGADRPGSARGGQLEARYDDAGNMTGLTVQRSGPCLPASASCAMRFAYEWDEVGRLGRARRWDLASAGSRDDPLPKTAPSAELTYVYDSNDHRVRKTRIAETGAPTHDLDLFASLELRGARFDDGTGDYERTAATEVPYLFARGVRLGRVVYGASDLPNVSAGQQHVFFELTDRMGSEALVIDKATSEVVESASYRPFGATESDFRPARWDGFREAYRFTGKEEDVELGILYVEKRYFAPLLGRWLSADPLALHGFGADPNVYAYVHGRVFSATDRSGLGEAFLTGPAPDSSSASSGAAASPKNPNDVYAPFINAPIPDQPSIGLPEPGQLHENPADTAMRAYVVGGTALTSLGGTAGAALTEFIPSLTQEQKLQVIEMGQTLGNIAGALAPSVAQWVRGRLDAAAARAAQSNKNGGDTVCPCFAGDTVVLTESGERPIDSIRVGDRVWSRDPETGETALNDVVRRFVTPTRTLNAVRLVRDDGGEETIHATPGHPFWVEGRGWTPAEDLAPGDRLNAPDGAPGAQVSSVATDAEPSTVYNLEVAGTHTYFVGATGALVHNGCDCGPKTFTREQAAGRTPSKSSLTGDEVFQLHVDKGEVRFGKNEGIYIKQPDGSWAEYETTVMGHRKDLVLVWPNFAQYGPKSPQIRAHQLHFETYRLEHGPTNSRNGSTMYWNTGARYYADPGKK